MCSTRTMMAALNSGDADFADFYVMVTNANGTETAEVFGIPWHHLDQSDRGHHGYRSARWLLDRWGDHLYDLERNDRHRGDGDLCHRSNGYVVEHDRYGQYGRIGNNRQYRPQCRWQYRLSEHPEYLDRDLHQRWDHHDDDGQGPERPQCGRCRETIQTDDTIDDSNSSGGTTTETLTNYAGGTVSSSTGELSGSGVSTAEKLNATTTTTVTNSSGKTATIDRDQLGGGWTTQQEVDTYDASGALTSIVVSDLNPDGSASSVTTTTNTAGASGSTQTVTTDIDDNSA